MCWKVIDDKQELFFFHSACAVRFFFYLLCLLSMIELTLFDRIAH